MDRVPNNDDQKKPSAGQALLAEAVSGRVGGGAANDLREAFVQFIYAGGTPDEAMALLAEAGLTTDMPPA